MGALNIQGAESGVLSDIVGLQSRLARWRRGRKRGERIPEMLWRGALETARQQGLAPAARLLKLDYYTLKKRLEAVAGKPAFIELGQMSMGGNGQAEWSIELEERRGTKVRVQYKGPQAPDLGLLGSSLWRTGR